jgi:DNA-binding CsgD family transcriptional regulator
MVETALMLSVRFAVDAGSWRARRLSDLVEPAWLESDYYEAHYLSRGYGDAIWAGCPVNQDIELVFVFFRSVDHPKFGIAERDLVAATLRGLGVLFRQYVLGYGLSVARIPLTTTERQVLKGLLDGQVEKQIAVACQQSRHNTHVHVKHIFQKFGVNNRASLVAIWLGSGLD